MMKTAVKCIPAFMSHGRELVTGNHLYKTLVANRYVSTTHRLHFMLKYMHKVANERDTERLMKFGADRTCAEWILRNGGRVRFVECKDWYIDYNLLPPEEESEFFHVQDIDASGAELMQNGFLHLDTIKQLQSMKIHDCRYVDDECMSLLTKVAGSLQRLQISSCKHVSDTIKQLQSMKIHDCRYVDDECMSLLTRVAGSLQRLQISSCKLVSDDGLKHLHGFSLLQELYLKDLEGVSDKIKSYDELKSCLPMCKISYPDAEQLMSQNT